METERGLALSCIFIFALEELEDFTRPQNPSLPKMANPCKCADSICSLEGRQQPGETKEFALGEKNGPNPMGQFPIFFSHLLLPSGPGLPEAWSSPECNIWQA